MARDAAERERVLVVHFTLEWIAARRGDFRGRDASLERVGGAEERVVHAERYEHTLVKELVERRAGRGFDEEAEHVSAEVEVLVAPARLADERRLDDRCACFGGGAGNAPKVAPRREARAV